MQTLEIYVLVEGGDVKLSLRRSIDRMTSSKIGQYRCLLKCFVCDDSEQIERDKQEKFDTKLNYKF